MNETQWQACHTPGDMIRFLGSKISERKLRLFGCAGCRRIWWLLRDERSRRAVEVSELFADGLASADELLTAATLADEAAAQFQPFELGSNAAQTAALVARTAQLGAERVGATVADAEMLRHICGNPFQPVTIFPDWLEWRDGAISKLARTIYDHRLFDDLPILGDALEEAGCTDNTILDHCRQRCQHMLGCWLLDLLLELA